MTDNRTAKENVHPLKQTLREPSWNTNARNCLKLPGSTIHWNTAWAHESEPQETKFTVKILFTGPLSGGSSPWAVSRWCPLCAPKCEHFLFTFRGMSWNFQCPIHIFPLFQWWHTSCPEKEWVSRVLLDFLTWKQRFFTLSSYLIGGFALNILF